MTMQHCLSSSRTWLCDEEAAEVCPFSHPSELRLAPARTGVPCALSINSRGRGCSIVCASFSSTGGRRFAFRRKKHVQLEPEASLKALVVALNKDDGSIIESLDYHSRWLQPHDWFTVFEELGKRDRWAISLEVFRWMQQQKWYRPDDGFYAKLISILGKKGQIRLANWLFTEMRKHGCRPDTSVFNALISSHLRSKHKERALGKAFTLFEQMKTKPHCQPNLVTYNTLLRACAQVKNAEKIDELFKEMELIGVHPDVYTFNGMLDAYGKAGSFLEMEAIWEQMRQKKVKPDCITFNTLIDAYGKAGLIVKMEQAFRSMAQANVDPQLSTFNSLINNYGTAGRTKEMELAFSNMSQLGVTPSLITYEVLLKNFGKARRYTQMRKCFNMMLKGSVQPMTSTLNIMLDAYCSEGLVEDAEKLLDSIGVTPGSSSFLILYRGCLKHKQTKCLDRLKKRMEVAGVKLDEEALSEPVKKPRRGAQRSGTESRKLAHSV